MTRYTDQFETVLPASVRTEMRFHASVIPPSPLLKSPAPMRRTSEVRVEEDKLLKPVLIAIPLLLLSGVGWFLTIPALFFLLEKYPKFRKFSFWTIFAGFPATVVMVLLIIFARSIASSHTSHAPYRPSPVVESLLANPTPWATPAPATEAPAPAPSSVLETRSQEPQWFEKWRYTEADMPYGEKVMSKYLGDLPNQEALPLTGNHLGDTYKIGKDYFTWVAPSGVAQWVDPVR